jgi:hypothetical protein
MPRRFVVVSLLSLALAVSGSRSALAQQAPKPDPSPRVEAAPSPRAEAAPRPAEKPAAARRDVPSVRLRVHVVLSRYRGDTKVLSLPYTFLVTSEGPRARMRMGVQTPIPAVNPAGAGTPGPPAAIQYKTVGTNIDCGAREGESGRYLLQLSIEHSSAFGGNEAAGPNAAPETPRMPGVPLFRSFEASFEPILRDGETQQIVASTDPITGEVLKIDVTLNVVK